MSFDELLSAVNAMSVDDRLRLVDAIWEGIEAEWERIEAREPVPELTEAQKQELDRRLADLDTNPDDEISWEDVNAELEARLKQ